MINTVKDVIDMLNNLVDYPDIESATEEDGDYNILASSSSSFLNHVDDDKLINGLEEIELSASYYFFLETSLINKFNLKKLHDEGFDIVKLDVDYSPFTHAIKTEKFHIFFSL